MTTGDLIGILQRTLYTMLVVAGPIVLATMAVGLVISIVQAATQVNEATLTFVPKLIVVAAIFMLAGPGMLQQLVDFTRFIFATAVEAAR
mgnify:CR=1 FL=1